MNRDFLEVSAFSLQPSALPLCHPSQPLGPDALNPSPVTALYVLVSVFSLNLNLNLNLSLVSFSLALMSLSFQVSSTIKYCVPGKEIRHEKNEID